jgi:hypothetical protein
MMATLANQSVDRTPSIGRVFTRAFAVMAHNPLIVFGTALLLAGIPITLFTHLSASLQSGRLGGFAFAGTLVATLLVLLVTLIARALVQGCLVRATVADSEGRRAGLGECVRTAANRLLPLIGVSLLLPLAIVVGLAMVIVPGIIVAMMYAVLVPVVVQERVGVMDAFTRTAFLTDGARWRILGLELLLLLMVWLLQGLSGLAQIALHGSLYHAFSLPALLLSLLVTTLSTILHATIQTALYVELRDWKDGPAGDRLSEIFA